MDIEANKAVVRQFIDAMSQGDTDTILALYSEDATLQTMGDTPISGTYDRAHIEEYAGQIFDLFPQGIRFTVHGMTAEDDRVAVEAESHGDHVSGQHYNSQYHFLFRLRDGQVVCLKEYVDTQKVIDVLMAPPAGS